MMLPWAYYKNHYEKVVVSWGSLSPALLAITILELLLSALFLFVPQLMVAVLTVLCAITELLISLFTALHCIRIANQLRLAHDIPGSAKYGSASAIAVICALATLLVSASMVASLLASERRETPLTSDY